MTYEEIIKKIQAGLSGDKQQDQAYLKQQMEEYKDHRYNHEIVRECGRMLYDLLDDAQKEKFVRSIEQDTEHIRSALKEVEYFLSKKDAAKANEVIEPIIKSMSQETMFKNDSKNVFYSFNEPFENVLYEYLEKPEQNVQRASIPYSDAYYDYARVCLELGEQQKAQEALKKAIDWNPMSSKVQLLYMESMKEDLERFFAFTKFAFQIIFHKPDLAKAYRNLAYYFDQKNLQRIAYGCHGISLQYEASEESVNYMNALNEQDWFSQPSMDEMREFAKKYEFPIGPDQQVVGLAYGYGKQCFEEGVKDGAKYFLMIAYDLTAAPEAKELLDQMETE